MDAMNKLSIRPKITVVTDREKDLEADLAIACKSNNPCLVCGHYRPDQNGYQKCELNEWVCKWEWRGAQYERKEAADGQ